MTTQVQYVALHFVQLASNFLCYRRLLSVCVCVFVGVQFMQRGGAEHASIEHALLPLNTIVIYIAFIMLLWTIRL